MEKVRVGNLFFNRVRRSSNTLYGYDYTVMALGILDVCARYVGDAPDIPHHADRTTWEKLDAHVARKSPNVASSEQLLFEVAMWSEFAYDNLLGVTDTYTVEGNRTCVRLGKYAMTRCGVYEKLRASYLDTFTQPGDRAVELLGGDCHAHLMQTWPMTIQWMPTNQNMDYNDIHVYVGIPMRGVLDKFKGRLAQGVREGLLKEGECSVQEGTCVGTWDISPTLLLKWMRESVEEGSILGGEMFSVIGGSLGQYPNDTLGAHMLGDMCANGPRMKAIFTRYAVHVAEYINYIASGPPPQHRGRSKMDSVKDAFNAPTGMGVHEYPWLLAYYLYLRTGVRLEVRNPTYLDVFLFDPYVPHVVSEARLTDFLSENGRALYADFLRFRVAESGQTAV